MVLDAHTEYLVINESVEETTTMLAEIVRFRKEDLTHALEAFSDSCDAHVDACRQLMVDTANVDWSHVGEMMRSLFPPSQVCLIRNATAPKDHCNNFQVL